jgi:hypothetical protein
MFLHNFSTFFFLSLASSLCWTVLRETKLPSLGPVATQKGLARRIRSTFFGDGIEELLHFNSNFIGSAAPPAL